MSIAFLLRFITGGFFLCLHGLHIKYSFVAFTKCLFKPQLLQTGKWNKRQQCFILCNFLINWLQGKKKELHQNLSKLLFVLFDWIFLHKLSSFSFTNKVDQNNKKMLKYLR